MSLIVLLALAGAGALVLGAGAVYGARRAVNAVVREGRKDYRQVEALIGIHSTLPIRRPLPPMRGWAASPDFASLVVDRILTKRPRTVVELGGGVSTIVGGYALNIAGRGHLCSFDHDPVFAQATERRVKEHGLDTAVTVVTAPLVPVPVGGERWDWYEHSAFEGIDRIDILIVDGPPARVEPLSRYPALPVLRSKLAEDAVIILDDANRRGEMSVVRRWLQEDPEWSVEWLDTEKGAAVLMRSVTHSAGDDAITAAASNSSDT